MAPPRSALRYRSALFRLSRRNRSPRVAIPFATYHDDAGFTAQIHAEEHATSVTAILAIRHPLTHCGSDEDIPLSVGAQAFCILPRINPDAAECTMTARIIRGAALGGCCRARTGSRA